jgi:hypothetical protein
MSNDANDKVAFPEKRLTRKDTRKSLWLMALFGFMVLMLLGGLAGGIIGYLDGKAGRDVGTGVGPWLMVAAMSVGGVIGLVWGQKYWKAIDEMAKRAHLDSWFWGGSIVAIPILSIGFMLYAMPEIKIDLIDRLAPTPSAAFGLGIWVTYIALLLGYTIFWLIWWAKKR